MKLINKSGYYLTILLVLFACFAQETEARRRVLRGRRTVTRTYYRGLAIPGWAVIVLVALGELIVGVILYFVMRKVVLSSSIDETNTYHRAMTDEV